MLQYEAEATATIEVRADLMPLLIGKGGEEINRIRQQTGAAIDAEREAEGTKRLSAFPGGQPVPPGLFKVRGTKAAVEAAKAAIADATEANSRVAESVVLPWHCIDVLLGADATNLKRLEHEYQTSIELPGQTLYSEIVGSASGELGFLASGNILQLRGRKKHVDALTKEIQRIARVHAVERVELDDDDADLLSKIVLNDAALFAMLQIKKLPTLEFVEASFEPEEGVVTLRGEDVLEAKIALQVAALPLPFPRLPASLPTIHDLPLSHLPPPQPFPRRRTFPRSARNRSSSSAPPPSSPFFPPSTARRCRRCGGSARPSSSR